MCMCMCVYIYIYILCIHVYTHAQLFTLLDVCVSSLRRGHAEYSPRPCGTPNLPTNIVDFRGFDSSIMLCLRGGILRPIGIS